MKNNLFDATATPAGFAMPSSCASVTFMDARETKQRDAHAGAGVAVRRPGSHSWMRFRSITD